jgi:osmotically-inducible protein OsmY
MMSIIAILVGALAGAGFMYLLDPQAGRRRRALVRDQLVKFSNRTEDAMEGASEEIKNRSKGMVLEAKKRIQEEMVDDATLVDRVRARMGRVISHPGAVEIMVRNGEVTLHGNVLADEFQTLINTVRAVPGVSHVNNQLLVHQEAGHIPDLQS